MLSGFASVGCRAWALYEATLAVQMIMRGHYVVAVFFALAFACLWHAAELAKHQSLDLLAKATSEQPATKGEEES